MLIDERQKALQLCCKVSRNVVLRRKGWRHLNGAGSAMDFWNSRGLMLRARSMVWRETSMLLGDKAAAT